MHLFFQCFDLNAAPPRSLPIVLEHRELVGPLTIELAWTMPCFVGIFLIRESQLPRKLPRRLRRLPKRGDWLYRNLWRWTGRACAAVVRPTDAIHERLSRGID